MEEERWPLTRSALIIIQRMSILQASRGWVSFVVKHRSQAKEGHSTVLSKVESPFRDQSFPGGASCRAFFSHSIGGLLGMVDGGILAWDGINGRVVTGGGLSLCGSVGPVAGTLGPFLRKLGGGLIVGVHFSCSLGLFLRGLGGGLLIGVSFSCSLCPFDLCFGYWLIVSDRYILSPKPRRSARALSGRWDRLLRRRSG